MKNERNSNLIMGSYKSPAGNYKRNSEYKSIYKYLNRQPRSFSTPNKWSYLIQC